MSSLATETAARVSRINVDADTLGRARLRGEHGVVAARQVKAAGPDLEVVLIATEATLLGGDDVRVEVVVGAGVRLTLRDVAATVAYDGCGRPASWSVSVSIGPGARLTWLTQPFVVTDGADVDRTLLAELAPGAGLRLHDAVVLGRHGQRGGRLRCRTRATYDGVPLLVEDVTYSGDPAVAVGQAFVRGAHRRIDTHLLLGRDVSDECAEVPGATVLDLAGPGRVVRTFG